MRFVLMATSRSAKIALVSVLLLSLVALYWSLSQTREVSSPFPEQEPSPYPMRITGFSYVTYDQEKPILKIEADEFKVNPRKYFVFNIRPFNEASLTNARLAVYLNEGASPGFDLLSLGKDILHMNEKGKSRVTGMGVITRGIIKGLVLEIYKAHKLSLVVTAKEAIIDFKKQEATLVRATIEDKLSHRRTTSRAVLWKAKDKVFAIPQEHTNLKYLPKRQVEKG